MSTKGLLIASLLRWLGLGLLFWTAWANASTEQLTQAHAVVTVHANSTLQQVKLPYHWDRVHPGLGGSAVFDLQFNLPEVPTHPYGLYIARLGNAYEVLLNGQTLQAQGDLTHDGGADFAKEPRLIVIPVGLLGENNNLQVHIRADVGRRGGLTPMVVGPMEEVEPLFLEERLWLNTGTVVVITLSLLVGFVALVLWATQLNLVPNSLVRHDALYLMAAIAELGWSTRVSDALVHTPPMPWVWWNMLMVFALAVWTAAMGMFCIHVAHWQDSKLAVRFRPLWFFWVLAAIPLSYFAVTWGKPMLLTFYYAGLNVIVLTFMLFFIGKAMGNANNAHRVVALALAVNALFGIRDIYAFRASDSFAPHSFLRYSSVLFGLSMLVIVLMRFRQARIDTGQLMTTMAHQIAEKERVLRENYVALERLARDNERSTERSRILRDMHDGVGSHISAAIRQLESGMATSGDVLLTLRESLDQLKLSIDAMSFPTGDITALLASLRYRLAARFNASGLELVWQVDDVAPLTGWDDAAMGHVQYMVFEAISNVMQHAQASQLRIELHPLANQSVGIQIVDNGAGFDTSNPAKNGLRMMQERAQALGADLKMQSQPGQTMVEIVLHSRLIG